MQIGIKCDNRSGFTLVELFVVIATIAMLGALLLPALAQTSKRELRTQCLNNLKLINLSFHIWEGDHGGKYPTAISTASGGAMENIFSQAGGFASAGYGLTNVFCVMSNKLNTPRILTCPADHSRTFLPTDTSTASGPVTATATNWADFGHQNLSYFVEGNASDRYPKMILIGDRNIGTSPAPGAAALAMNMGNDGYTTQMFLGIPSGLGPKNIKSFPWGWTDTDLHESTGNLGMADGSVQQTSLSGLWRALTDTVNARGPGPPKMNNTILNMP